MLLLVSLFWFCKAWQRAVVSQVDALSWRWNTHLNERSLQTMERLVRHMRPDAPVEASIHMRPDTPVAASRRSSRSRASHLPPHSPLQDLQPAGVSVDDAECTAGQSPLPQPKHFSAVAGRPAHIGRAEHQTITANSSAPASANRRGVQPSEPSHHTQPSRPPNYSNPGARRVSISLGGTNRLPAVKTVRLDSTVMPQLMLDWTQQVLPDDETSQKPVQTIVLARHVESRSTNKGNSHDRVAGLLCGVTPRTSSIEICI